MTPKQLARWQAFRVAGLARCNDLTTGLLDGGEPALASVRRTLHTMKGEASLLGYADLAALLHRLEDEIADGVNLSERAWQISLEVLATSLRRDTPGADAEVTAYLARARGRVTAGAPLGPAAKPAKGALVAQGIADSQAGLSMIRVPASRLDALAQLTSELAMQIERVGAMPAEIERARTMLSSVGPLSNAQRTATAQSLVGLAAQLRDIVFSLGRLTTDLGASQRELAMVPASDVLGQYPGLVERLSAELGKRVRLEVAGAELELERDTLAALAEPLLHLVANAIDHGLEAPAIRAAARKPPLGQLFIGFELQGTDVRVTVRDDGAGIRRDVLRQRAITLGLVRADAELDDASVVELIFEPGMSTRDEVSATSGRGVGMDAVRAAITAAGGAVSVRSEAGRGTAIELALPVSAAATRMAELRVGRVWYGVPLGAVREVLELEANPTGPQGFAGKRWIGDRWVRTIDLATALGQVSDQALHARAVVVESGAHQAALLGFDEVRQTTRIVQRADGLMATAPLCGGVVPTADGDVVIVLRLSELLRAASMGTRATPTAHAIKVLVADDSPVIRDLVCETLRAHGLHVVEASNGREALEQLRRQPGIGLIVTDIEMPEMGGIELIGAVRREFAGRRLPCVVLSMRGSDQDKRRALDVGADAYLVKSDFTQAALWTLVRRTLGPSA